MILYIPNLFKPAKKSKSITVINNNSTVNIDELIKYMKSVKAEFVQSKGEEGEDLYSQILSLIEMKCIRNYTDLSDYGVKIPVSI